MCLLIPAKVTACLPGGMGRVCISGVEETVNLSLLREVAVGDYVAMQVGFAVKRLDPEEAAQTLALIDDMRDRSARTP